MNRKDYLMENDQYYSNLNIGLNYLKQISNELCTFNVDIRNKPWYKNLMEIYVPKTFEFYNNCKKCNFNIEKFNDIWIRSEYKSLLSEVEKFIKFIIKTIFKMEDINFNRSINELENVVLKYKNLFNKNWENSILNIKDILHIWRNNYNENKHDEEKIDDSFYIQGKAGICIGNDILEYVSDFVYRIVCPLLESLLIIVKNF